MDDSDPEQEPQLPASDPHPPEDPPQHPGGSGRHLVGITGQNKPEPQPQPQLLPINYKAPPPPRKAPPARLVPRPPKAPPPELPQEGLWMWSEEPVHHTPTPPQTPPPGHAAPQRNTPTPPQTPPPGHAAQQRKPEYTFGEDKPWFWAKAGAEWVDIDMAPPAHAPITPRSSQQHSQHQTPRDNQSDVNDWSKGILGRPQHTHKPRK